MMIRVQIRDLFIRSEVSEQAGPEKGSSVRPAAARPVLCDGAMGTMFYGGGVFINRCYDELNISQPELVRNIRSICRRVRRSSRPTLLARTASAWRGTVSPTRCMNSIRSGSGSPAKL
jgi:hypothetical protein